MDLRQGVADIPWILAELGVEKAIVSPGSRNAPLVNSFAASRIYCLPVVDERSAAYMAVGLARVSKKPVVLICTSGTAVLNYSPGIAEAFYQEVPVIVITADRPLAWIDQRDGQTIRQDNVYANFIKRSYTMPEKTADDCGLQDFHGLIYRACNKAMTHPRGPVHLNIPLAEPLYKPLPKPSPLSVLPLEGNAKNNIQLDPAFLESWNNANRKMIVVGFADPDQELTGLLSKVSKMHDVAILAENLANTKITGAIACQDRLFFGLENEEREGMMPDLLISIGGAVLSKQFKIAARKHRKNMVHWHVDEAGRGFDTFMALAGTIQANPVSFIDALLQTGEKPSGGYVAKVLELEAAVHDRHLQYTGETGFSDLKVFHLLHQLIPSGSILHMGNSTVVRYFQLMDSRNDIFYLGNRGVSGIDGSISTAIGNALATGALVTAVVGDLSFFYDSNALFNKHIPKNLRIIVINNNGGDIFRIIDEDEQLAEREELYCTQADISVCELARAYGIIPDKCTDLDSLEEKLKVFYQEGDAKLLEIDTTKVQNASVFHRYKKFLKA